MWAGCSDVDSGLGSSFHGERQSVSSLPSHDTDDPSGGEVHDDSGLGSMFPVVTYTPDKYILSGINPVIFYRSILLCRRTLLLY